MRHLRYTGPGAVLIALQHERAVAARVPLRAVWPRRAPAVTVRELLGARPLEQAQVIELGPGSQLLVRPTSAEER
jgi:hypothetical protein